MKTRIALTMSLIALAATSLTGCQQHRQQLFDGQSLEGWTKHGGEATYSVEDGCIVGRRGPGPNTFLCTDQTFEDFDLELEFRWDELCNSGVQFRSTLDPVEGRVQGYQCEMDPSDRSWTCGLFYEGPRGWLDPLDDNEAGRAARRLDDWNHMRIRAQGPHVRTWLNGVPCANFVDEGGDQSGFIGLQVHGGRQGQVRWRNIRITEL